MKLNIVKKITLISISAFLFTGCNIYRQMVIPTPYYPSTNAQTSINENNSVATETTSNETIDASSEVPQHEVVTPANEGSVKVQNKTVVQRIPFPESEYKSLSKTGSATVKGSIYLTTATGNKIYGKHTRLYLNPETSYSTQWYKESYLGGAKMSKVDPRLYNYLKFTTSDANGKFEFLNVPSGSYYLIGVVKCGKECGYNTVKNIRITKKISVFGSDIQSVDLSKTIK